MPSCQPSPPDETWSRCFIYSLQGRNVWPWVTQLGADTFQEEVVYQSRPPHLDSHRRCRLQPPGLHSLNLWIYIYMSSDVEFETLEMMRSWRYEVFILRLDIHLKNKRFFDGEGDCESRPTALAPPNHSHVSLLLCYEHCRSRLDCRS
jgi:hypothetical protein